MNSVVVNNKEQLKKALDSKAEYIIVRGKLAKKLKPLSKVKKSKDTEKLSESMYQAALITYLGVLPVKVAITLIVTVGVATIVALLKDYNIKYKIGEEEFVFERG